MLPDGEAEDMVGRLEAEAEEVRVVAELLAFDEGSATFAVGSVSAFLGREDFAYRSKSTTRPTQSAATVKTSASTSIPAGRPSIAAVIISSDARSDDRGDV